MANSVKHRNGVFLCNARGVHRCKIRGTFERKIIKRGLTC